jgi:type II secretory pathway pseudopilin PulG
MTARSLQHINAQRQQGAALIVGLIMLVLITLMATSTFTLSTGNLQSVGNMQFRTEAVAAGNQAIEQVLSSPFTNSPQAEEIMVDINNDGTNDYKVEFAAPVCISAVQVTSNEIPPSGIALGPAFSTATVNYFETVWDLAATVSDESQSGAAVQLHEGVKVLLPESQYNASCS